MLYPATELLTMSNWGVLRDLEAVVLQEIQDNTAIKSARLLQKMAQNPCT